MNAYLFGHGLKGLISQTSLSGHSVAKTEGLIGQRIFKYPIGGKDKWTDRSNNPKWPFGGTDRYHNRGSKHLVAKRRFTYIWV